MPLAISTMPVRVYNHRPTRGINRTGGQNRHHHQAHQDFHGFSPITDVLILLPRLRSRCYQWRVNSDNLPNRPSPALTACELGTNRDFM